MSKRDQIRGGIRRNRQQSEMSARVQESMPVSKLRPGEQQARERYDEESLRELAASIRKYGVLNPIVVDRGGVIIAGERRWRAAKLAGEAVVPVFVLQQHRLGQRREISLIENIQRVDLHPLEQARAFKDIMDAGGLTQIELGERLGKSNDYISKSLQLLRLDEGIQKEWLADVPTVAKSVMVELSRLDQGGQVRRWVRIKRAALGAGASPRPKAERKAPAKAPQPRRVIASAAKFRELVLRADPTNWKADTRRKLRDELLEMRSVLDEKLVALE